MALSERAGREGADSGRVAQVDRLRDLHGRQGDPVEHYARIVREEFANPALAEGLLNSEQWPQMAADLAHLEAAGVDARKFLGDAGRMADRLAYDLTPRAEDRQAKVVRENLPRNLAEPLLNSERWPQLAEQMRQMHSVGVDVPQMLRQAATAGVRLEEAMAAAWQRQSAQAAGLEKETPARQEAQRDSRPRIGNASAGSSNRADALADVHLSAKENAKYVRMVRESVPDQHQAAVLVVSRQWPLIAAEMRDLESRGIDPAARLARVPQEVSRMAATGERVDLAAAADHALSQPAPATATTQTITVQPSAEATHATTLSAAEQNANLEKAAATAGACLGVSAGQLMSTHGFDAREAGRVLTELQSRGIVESRSPTGTYRAKVENREEALTKLGASNQSTAESRTAAATSISITTSSAPTVPTSPTVAAAPGPHTPTRTATHRR